MHLLALRPAAQVPAHQSPRLLVHLVHLESCPIVLFPGLLQLLFRAQAQVPFLQVSLLFLPKPGDFHV